MSGYDLLLFLHITAALVAFGMSAFLHGTEWLARRAQTVAELRPLGTAMRYGFVMPLSGTTLVGLGVALVLDSPTDEKFGFGDPFVWCGLAAFVLLTASGAVMAPYARAITEAVEAATEGPISPELHRIVFPRSGVVVGHMTTALLVAVVFDMTTKPNALVAPLVLVVGLAVGALLGNRMAAVPAPLTALSRDT